MADKMRVVIIGTGIGGLTLAQALHKEGISVAVYERDLTPTDRLQGIRIHIAPYGSAPPTGICATGFQTVEQGWRHSGHSPNCRSGRTTAQKDDGRDCSVARL